MDWMLFVLADAFLLILATFAITVLSLRSFIRSIRRAESKPSDPPPHHPR